MHESSVKSPEYGFFCDCTMPQNCRIPSGDDGVCLKKSRIRTHNNNNNNNNNNNDDDDDDDDDDDNNSHGDVWSVEN